MSFVFVAGSEIFPGQEQAHRNVGDLVTLRSEDMKESIGFNAGGRQYETAVVLDGKVQGAPDYELPATQRRAQRPVAPGGPPLRGLQNFKLGSKQGTWTLKRGDATVESGKVSLDANGLLTIGKLPLSNEPAVLTISQ